MPSFVTIVEAAEEPGQAEAIATLTAYQTRPNFFAVSAGAPAGFAIEYGRTFDRDHPELGLDVHVGWLIGVVYGTDLVYRPLAAQHNWTPTLKAGLTGWRTWYGVNGERSTVNFGMPSLTTGIEVRAGNGFKASADAGVMLVAGDGALWVLPSAELSLGYAF